MRYDRTAVEVGPRGVPYIGVAIGRTAMSVCERELYLNHNLICVRLLFPESARTPHTARNHDDSMVGSYPWDHNGWWTEPSLFKVNTGTKI